MPVITPIENSVPLNYAHTYDRVLTFEDDEEFGYIQLAARARIAYRKAKTDKPIPNDEYLLGLQSNVPALYTNQQWIYDCGILLDDFIERGIYLVPPNEPDKKLQLRDKVAAFARDLHIANQVFEESRDVEVVEMFADFWRE